MADSVVDTQFVLSCHFPDCLNPAKKLMFIPLNDRLQKRTEDVIWACHMRESPMMLLSKKAAVAKPGTHISEKLLGRICRLHHSFEQMAYGRSVPVGVAYHNIPNSIERVSNPLPPHS